MTAAAALADACPEGIALLMSQRSSGSACGMTS
jgi:hypothetical protein